MRGLCKCAGTLAETEWEETVITIIQFTLTFLFFLTSTIVAPRAVTFLTAVFLVWNLVCVSDAVLDLRIDSNIWSSSLLMNGHRACLYSTIPQSN